MPLRDDGLLCYDCDELLNWDGDLPEEEEDWDVLCYDCALKRLEKRLEVLETFKAECEWHAHNGDSGDLVSYVLEQMGED